MWIGEDFFLENWIVDVRFYFLLIVIILCDLVVSLL